MTFILNWKNDFNNKCVMFYCIKNDELISPSDWLLQDIVTAEHKKASSGKLYLFLEEEKAYIYQDYYICVPYDEVADFSKTDLRLLGLPEPVPYRLMIECYGSPAQKNFKLKFTFFHTNGRPVIGTRLQGIVLSIGTKIFFLINPLYRIFYLIEQINNEKSLDKRLLLLSRLNSLTQRYEDVNSLEKYLKSLTICEASKFTIRPYYNSNNEPDFDIIMLDTEEQELLPKKYLDSFNKQFIAFDEVRTKYPLGNNWYLLFSEELQRVLSVVRKIKLSDPTIRGQFLLNPYNFLSQLEEEFNLDVSEYFSELNYSERVKEVGLWIPRIVPLVAEKDSCLSKVSLGMYVYNELLEFDENELSQLINKVEHAIDENKFVVEYKGYKFPAIQDFLTYLKSIYAEHLTSCNYNKDQFKEVDDKRPHTLQIRTNEESVEFLIKKAKRPGNLGVPKGLKHDLLPHQLEGLYWFQRHWIKGSSGCVLADDMGLGKTFQALVFLKWVKDLMRNSLIKSAPFLIVAPTGLLKNWKEEIYKHLYPPGLGSILEVYGKNLKRLKLSNQNEIYVHAPILDILQLKNFDVVLVSYETLRNYQKSFGLIDWNIIIFDEAQKIKNPGTMISDAAKAMKFEFSIALTGTPIENRLSDLWSIVDTVSPGTLKTLKEFVDYYEKGNRLNELKKFLMEDTDPPLLLRRIKENILEGLPPKKAVILKEEMPEFQATIYNNILLRGGYSSNRILEIIHQLKFVSLHPCTIQSCDQDLINDPKAFLNHSARTSKFLKILDSIYAKQEKVLIFIEYRDFQARLADLISRIYGIKPFIINGSIPGNKRLKYVNEFSNINGFHVMILSPRAAGIGLNLTAANHVIHLTRWWNPAVEDQCTDRAFRIGQQRTVYVYFPLAIHPEKKDLSFDNRLHELIAKKRELAINLLAPPDINQEELIRHFQPILNNS